MFEAFDGNARQVILRAENRAREFRHNYLGTEHLLLSMTAIPGRIASLLADSGASEDHVRQSIMSIVGRGIESPASSLPWTERVKRVLQNAAEGGGACVTPEDLLRAILDDGDGVAVQVLDSLAVDQTALKRCLTEAMPLGRQGLKSETRDAAPFANSPSKTPWVKNEEKTYGLQRRSFLRQREYRAIATKFTGPAPLLATFIMTGADFAPPATFTVLAVAAAYIVWALLPYMTVAFRSRRGSEKQRGGHSVRLDPWTGTMCAAGSVAILAACAALVRESTHIGGYATVLAGLIAVVIGARLSTLGDRFGGIASFVLGISQVASGVYMWTSPQNLAFLPAVGVIATLVLLRGASVRAWLRFATGAALVYASVLLIELGYLSVGVTLFGAGVVILSVVGLARRSNRHLRAGLLAAAATGAGVAATGFASSGQWIGLAVSAVLTVGFVVVIVRQVRAAG